VVKAFAMLALVASTASADPVGLTLDSSEAELAIKIVREHRMDPALFATEPYIWLKAREAAMGRAFTDAEFQTFLLSADAKAKLPQWEQTLAAMKRADLHALATGVLAWLPPGAEIHARVFPEIKPRTNSFVWRMPDKGPAIFLYLDKLTTDQFENTVAHESHHIGLDSLEARQTALVKGLPDHVKRAITFLGAFGEGEAMLAAAGADRHPHWEDDAATRARWDSDMMHFNDDVPKLEQLFADILDGKLATDDDVMKRAAPFWGDTQGAWYTVGYEMAVLVERRFGRAALTDCMIDPRKLLSLYNQVAREAAKQGGTLATWSPQLLARLK
jgi:hypothetical protein